MKTSILCTFFLIVCFPFFSIGQPTGSKFLLKDNWAVQSSSEIKSGASDISKTGFNVNDWYATSMPSTVLAALVANKVYPDPYFGTNFNNLPGSNLFKVAWWYRTEFRIPADYKKMHTWLQFHSINYKANVWLNGKLIADTTTIEGAYRLFNLDISKAALAGENNCLALEIFPPKGVDLTITWADWNPTPPDRAMGIWYDVSIHATGDVAIENPFVITKLNLPLTDQAKLTVSADLRNSDDSKITGVLKGTIENIIFSQNVTLEPGETKTITFLPESFPQLIVSNPRLWWPHTVGPQNLYNMDLSFETSGITADTKKVRFGIREITSWMNNFDKLRTKVFQVNGKNIVIRGGGYVQDMMLRPSNERIDADIMYAKHMNLNALRMEAPRGSDYLFERCDEEGILLMVGWCCGNPWESWKRWTPHTGDVAEASWKDLIVHLRNHPSVFNWLYGSDYYPPAEIEKRYLKVLSEYDNTRPSESSATQAASSVAGITGVHMGPFPDVYSYETPTFWYTKLEFNTEAAPAGEQIPPIETLRWMMPEKDMWPMSLSWDLRLRKPFYPIARTAFEARYGKPGGIEEYCMKAQVFQNESVKAMFEAFAGNKYKSSGIIYWMYNSAWPKMYWQLYDYFFMPNGAFYGAKTGCEPLHIQYCYNDSSIKIVNSFYHEYKGLKAKVRMFDFNLKEVFSRVVETNIASDTSLKILTLEAPKEISRVYFLKLGLNDSSGKEVSSNFYWLCSNGDSKADFTDLDKLQATQINVKASAVKKKGDKCSLTVTIVNSGTSLAFAVNPKILKLKSKDPVLPVFWQDNYFSLLPKEKRTLTVEYDVKNLNGERPLLKVDGWNVEPVEKEVR